MSKTYKSKRDESRENTLTVPMKTGEKERIRKTAGEKGLTMASFVRMVLNDFFKKEEFK